MFICKPWLSWSALIVPFLMVGCASIGPELLPKDRFNYNLVMNQSNQQELLLNIVRLRYDENPMVLKVSSISGSSSYSESLSISGSLTLPAPGKGNGDFSPSPSLSYSDNPVISYTPLDDQAFFQSFLSQLDLYDVYVLLKSGWSIPRLMRIGFQRIGKANNAMSSARATSSHVPEYRQFLKVVYILRRMQLAEAISGYYSKEGDVEELILVIDKDFHLTPKERAVFKEAGIEIHDHKIILSNYPGPKKVYVVTRSLLGVYHYLSKGVLEPSEDIDDKILTQTAYEDGKPFDWQNVLRGMMKVYHSTSRPVDAFVSIHYRGRWYYIKDSDSDAKQTFALMTCISGLVQSPAPANTAPALTRTV